MGYRYYLRSAESTTKLAYSVNGNLFWDMTLEEMLKMVQSGWEIVGENGTRFNLTEFMWSCMNGKRHVLRSEFVKYNAANPGETFPVYDPETDANVYTFK
jgi:hypothetical protein